MDRNPRYHIPTGGKPVLSGDWTAPLSTRPLAHSRSSPPSSRFAYNANRYMAMPDPNRYLVHNLHPDSQHAFRSNASWQFPEPQLTRVASAQASLQPPQSNRPRSHSGTDIHPNIASSASHPNLRHKYSQSDGSPSAGVVEDEYGSFPERSPSISPSMMSEEIARLSLGEPAEDGLASANGLERFHNGEGDDNDWAWHILVTKEARESLPMSEVMRQSAMFDLINGERSYVNDLKLVHEVFIDGLREASPPILPPDKLEMLLRELFWNMDLILSHHQRMLSSLFALQREQHPILLNIGHIILDCVLKFQVEYESYIKHYPLAESLHKRERQSNAKYRAFLESASHDPRLGKRDLTTFISRPVTRLPRLSLQLSEVKKRTERLSDTAGDGSIATKKEYPDLETIPIVLDVLDSLVKSTQPGIEASESKVKYHALCESLRYRKGEIIDMDLYDESRALLHSGPLSRRQSDTWHSWTDLDVSLLDNYVIITKHDESTGYKVVVSRPIPLEYLRLGPFDAPPENRREDRSEGGGLLESIIKPTRPVFPLVFSHASSSARKYTLYANTDNARKKWKEAFENALGLRKVVADANKWFAVNSIDDGFFRSKAPSDVWNNDSFTGRITSAVSFSSGGRQQIVVATPTGVYAGFRGQSGSYVKILHLQSVSAMSALPGFNKLLVQHDGSLIAYSLEIIGRAAQNQVSPKAIDASLERLAGPGRNGPVSFYRVGTVAGKTLVVYAVKSFMQHTLYALEAVASKSPNFRQYGDSFYVPKEPFDVIFLAKTIAVCTDRSIVILDPTNLAGQTPVSIPDFSRLTGHESPYDSPMDTLKAKCDHAKPIGIVRCGKEELIVIYDEFGCYLTKYGVPTRKCGFVRWETKVTAYVQRGSHILLFSPQFIEVRFTPTGRFVQVIEGQTIRPLQAQAGTPLLVAMRGKKNDKHSISDTLVEIVETAPIELQPQPVTNGSGSRHGHERGPSLWDEWD